MPFRAGAPFLRLLKQRRQHMYRQLYQCPLGLVLHFYGWSSMEHRSLCRVSMPFRASTPFLPLQCIHITIYMIPVSMPSRAEAPFLQVINVFVYDSGEIVSMPSRAKAPFLRKKHYVSRKTWNRYQCPFGLKLHFYQYEDLNETYVIFIVSMPFRAEAPFLR